MRSLIKKAAILEGMALTTCRTISEYSKIIDNVINDEIIVAQYNATAVDRIDTTFPKLSVSRLSESGRARTRKYNRIERYVYEEAAKQPTPRKCSRGTAQHKLKLLRIDEEVPVIELVC